MWILDELYKMSKVDTPAIIRRDKSISFSTLWDKSDTLASYIIEHSKTKAPVVIYGNKDIEITIAMIACLKAGHAYVPLDIMYPPYRIKEIMKELENELIFNFTNEELDSYAAINLSNFHEIIEEYQTCKKVSTDNYVKEDDICYILFTSGSTGKAKGVQISKKNIQNFTGWFSRRCEIAANNSIVMNQVSYSFDVSLIPLYIYLSMGKTLFNIDYDMTRDLTLLFEYFRQSNIAVWTSTPAFLEICSMDDNFNDVLLPRIEKFILAGEVLTKKLVTTVKNKFPNAEIINGYGPTEGTVLLSACTITDKMLNDERSLPIGEVLDDAVYRICDEDGKEVKKGDTGELIIASKSISQGYFKNTEQTKKAFSKYGQDKYEYKTGDLVFEHDGMLYFEARKDSQIKLNGYRIELMDISENLNKLEIVSNSVVLPFRENGKVLFLAAFITLTRRPKDVSDFKIGIEIKSQLKRVIPSYMIPKKLIILDCFPINVNGKIDRQKLKEEYL